MSTSRGPVRAAIAGSLLVFVAVACGSDDPQPAPPAAAEEASAPAEESVRPDREPLTWGPVSADGLRAVLGTADLGLGENRVGFAVTSPDMLITAPVATVFSSYHIDADWDRTPMDVNGIPIIVIDPGPDAEGELKEIATAEFQQWPYGTRGLYTTQLDFDAAGFWGIDIAVEDSDGSLRRVKLFFEVTEASSAPPVGAAAIKSVSRTLADVETLAQLSTGSMQDPDLYQTTIAGAIESGMPTVVVFASPAFCTNAVCGPQVEVLRELKDQYKGQANFIHVDFYDNPDEIQGDLDKSRISATVLEWNLPSNEWSFVIDGQGVVTSRFEAFVTLTELEEALQQVL